MAVLSELLDCGAHVRALIVDGRNLFKPGPIAEAGLTYLSIGRAPAFAADPPRLGAVIPKT